jgi:hypothetical protein
VNTRLCKSILQKAFTGGLLGQATAWRNNIGDYVLVMTLELKLRKIGNSVGIVLPKEALAHAGARRRRNVGVGLCRVVEGKFKTRMSNPAPQLVQKLWNYCNILRDDGLSYGDYVEQLTFLLFGCEWR